MSRTSHTVSLFIVFVMLMAAVIGAPAQRAHAAEDWVDATTILVTTLLDKIDPNDGFCSLREAMQRAFDNSLNNQVANDCPQSTSGNTTIQIAIPGNIVISNGVNGGQLPNIRNIVTILGPATIDATNAQQILFDVETDGKLNFINVNIKNAKWTAIDSRGELKIAGGKFENNSAGGAGGGAIRNDGTAIIAGATFTNNKAVRKTPGEGAKDGGAIRSSWVLTVTGSTFKTNVSDGEGGAIKIQAGRMSIVDSTFTGNVTEGSFCNSCYGAGGGAIATTDSGNVYPFIIKRGIFNGNAALKGVGGAIFHKAGTLMTITDSTFQGNHAGAPGFEAVGGAIHNVYDMEIKRSTFTGNSVQGNGGAVSTETSGGDHTLTLRMVAFTGNNASSHGGALASMGLNSSVAKIDAKGVQITANIAGDSGGGIYVNDSKYDKAEFKMSVWQNLPQNCRDANPLDDNLPKPAESNPPIDSKGKNSFSDNSCEDDDDEDDKESDAVNPDPQLEAPAFNGGVPGMLTQKPAVTSPLVDKIDPAQNDNDPDTQQDIRGMQRPMNGDGIGLAFFDIGPFERDDASPKFSSLPAPLGVIDVGSVGQGAPYNKVNALVAYNGGDSALTLSAGSISGANAGEFVVGGLPANVGANGSTQIAVQCTPAGAGNRTATLTFTTNDPAFPSVSYTLKCTGTAGAGYGATVNPPGPLARSTVLGSPDLFFLGVQETGGAQLTLSNPQLISDPPGAITLQTSFPINIPNGGAQVPIGLQCTAPAIGVQTATFTFNTNDSSKPTVSYNIVCTVNKANDAFFGPHNSSNQGLSGVAGPYGIAISPDGKHVYVADRGDNRIAAYAVNSNNTLTFIGNTNSGVNQFIGPLQIAVSADGANVYVTGQTSNSLATFARDAETGALTYIDTVKNGDGYGCVLLQNCAGSVAGMAGAYGIALSPDGKFIYVSSIGDSSVVVFRRDANTGAASSTALLGSGAYFVQRFTHASLTGAYGLTISPDGAYLYVAGYTSDSVLALKRNPTTGELSFVQALNAGNVSNLNGVFRVLLTAGGDFLYTASYDSDAVCGFKRNAIDGTLTNTSCSTSGTYLDAASDMALTPDGKNMLVTGFNSKSVAVFARSASFGFLSFREAIYRDVNTGFPTLGGARGIVVNPNGKAAYATGFNDDSVVTLVFAQPKPVITGLTPASKPAGATNVLLSVNGIDFTPQSVVKVNGANRPTNFINDTLLTVNMPDSDFANAGNLNITVFTPTPGGGTSNSATFIVLAPGAQAVPAIDTISVLGLQAGGNGVNITVKGQDFASGAAVLFNGSPRPTTFVSSSELQATLSAADLATVGPVVIAVTNVLVVQNFSAFDADGIEVIQAVDVGTNKSNNAVLNVVAPNQNVQPSITSLSQNSIAMLSAIDQLEVIVNGSGFTVDSVALWNDAARPTKFISANQLQMTLNAGDFTASSIAAIKVTNPAPGGGESNVVSFFVLGPVPEVYYHRLRLPLVAR
jgi:6-phosphogluconolactonase (cycloisomerase 2 family)